MTDIHQRLAALTPKQRALLEQLKRKTFPSAIVTTPAPIPRRASSELLCLSPAQERLWFVQQITPESAAYHIAIAWQFTGKLQPMAVQASLNAIVARHESLRMRITEELGRPLPQVVSSLELAMPVVDLRELPPAQQIQVGDRLARQEAQLPFDLGQAPLLRATLICQTETWILLLTLHHLIADGWSRGVLLREFAQIYGAIVRGEAVALPELPIQYGDYALWQRQKATRGEGTERHQAYWRQQLADLAVLELPTDYPRPAIPSGRGKTISTQLPLALLNGVKQTARRAGVTVFMVLLAAFKLLLYRYTDQTDIAVGVPVANRDRPELEGLIGFFVNTLVLRSRLEEQGSFHDLLRQVHQVVADAFAHQEMPFSQVVELLQPDRHLSHNPLFQVMFQFQNQAYQLQNALAPEVQLPDVTLTQTWRDLGSTKFDLTWHLIEQPDGIQTVVEYSPDLFRAETIARMVGHFQVLLEHIVRDPQQSLCHIPLLPPAELQQLQAWGCGRLEPALLTPFVHQRFEAQAAQTPDAIAVVCGESFLTYAALNGQANHLAEILRSQGVGPETLVGVYLERTPMLLVALLAIWKAGGAYVPLDTSLGRDRLTFLLTDAQPRLILTTVTLAPQLSAPIPVLPLGPDALPRRDRNLDLPLTGANLAYVIYTSGSTGVPKGTLLTHAGLANYLNWCCQEYAIARGDGAPVQSSIGFDATMTSLYAPLLVGRTVYLLPETNEILSLHQVLQTQPNLSLIKLTPAHLNGLSALLPASRHPHPPRALIIGGEALTEAHLSWWRTHAPQTRLINEYGPTETVVGCCVYEASHSETIQLNSPESFQVPIGRPIPNTQLYVLDRHLQPVPIGVPGELYISGAGVARGYLNRPDLTTERFIPNPLKSSPKGEEPESVSSSPIWGKGNTRGEGRLYKTGDRVRWLSDGTLVYLGRLDHQIKLRGFRVEPGEIEAVLMQHPAIAQALVICRTAPSQQPCLVAYLIAHPGQSSPSASELRAFLAPKLPDYMHPSSWVWLQQFPLTSNGKIDRAALPSPTFDAMATDDTPPQTEIEQQLVQIWQELLGVPVGIHSNFFELGGDSILSLQFIARANQAGFSFTPQQLFQHQTIAQLASIQNSKFKTQHSPPLPSSSPPSPFPLLPIQCWLVEQNLHNLDYYNQAILLNVVPGLNPEVLRQVWHSLWQHHHALRLRPIQTEQGWQQIAGDHAPPPLLELDLAGLPSAVQSTVITQVATSLQASLNLTTGEIACLVLFRLGHNPPDRLLWILHHWVVDGVSWRILLTDLALAYTQLEQGQPLQLPPKTTSVQAWTQHLTSLAQTEPPSSELEYWTKTAAIAIALPPLPVDYLAPAAMNTVATAAEVSLHLDEPTTQQLLQDVPRAYRNRVDEVLLTALVESVAGWTRSRQLRVDLEHHGREAIDADFDLSRTVGWLTTLYPVVLDLRSTTDPGASLKAVKEQLRQVPNHGLGYGVWRYVRRPSPLPSMPAADLRFNYLGQLDRLPSNRFSLGFASESVGNLQHPQNRQSHLLVLNSFVIQQQLQIRWQYSHHFHDRGTIKKLAQSFLISLRKLIQHCLSPEAGGLTPSDVAAARLNQSQLDQFLTRIQAQKRF